MFIRDRWTLYKRKTINQFQVFVPVMTRIKLLKRDTPSYESKQGELFLEEHTARKK